MDRTIYMAAGPAGGRVKDEALEAAMRVRSITGRLPDAIFLPSTGAIKDAHEIARRTGCTVHILEADGPAGIDAAGASGVMARIAGESGGSVILAPHTSFGLELAPLLASRLDAAIIPCVERVGLECFSRSIHGGRFVENIRPASRHVVCTIVIEPTEDSDLPCAPDGRVVQHRIEDADPRRRLLEVLDPVHRASPLKGAEVIVAVGRGLGGPENLRLARDLASLFQRSAIGASRGACDLKWLDYSLQIGATGQSVAPRLYIACGISGAVQHTSGIRGAQTIVAVNTDPEAAIFRLAHVCIVEDLATFIPILTEELKRARSG
jgi:electron transfer flavoprotein alpha subunit